LLEYEENKNNKNINEKNIEEIKTNPMDSYSLREGSTAVLEEFLKNLSQDIDNKTEILSTFEEFLKQNQKWPKFSKTDIIKLYVGNINNSTINQDKKWSFCPNKLNSKMKCLSGNNLNKKEFENEEMAKNKLINTKKCLSNLGKFKGSNKNSIFKDYYDSDNDDDSDSYCNLKGLFYYIGDFDNNILLSFSCL
jgi:vancomycin resistance protein YoaR